MQTISIDFETRSSVDLRRSGVYVYAEHPHTDILCMAYAVDDGEPGLWTPGQPAPTVFDTRKFSYVLRAWNAQFERTIWRHVLVPKYGFPQIPMERFYCTAADAAAMALPRNLEDCAAVLRVEQQKDAAAWRAVVRLSRPAAWEGSTPKWWSPERDPARFQILYDYCKQDVRTERAIGKATRRLDVAERRVYLLDQRINDRGVLADMQLARAMEKLTEEALERANTDIDLATSGAVSAVTQVGRMTDWINGQGVAATGVSKTVVRELLEGNQPDAVRQVLEARAEAGRSSMGKIEAFKRSVSDDGRVRGMLLYHGANTGRWAGRLVQPHNFPRGDVPNAHQFIPDLLAGNFDLIDAFYPVLSVASSNLRAIFHAAPGHVLRVADFAQIEARVLAWVAGQHDLVAEFAKAKHRVYEKMAEYIYRLEAGVIGSKDPRRQIGKNTVLGCGYQLGAKTFEEQVYVQTGVRLGKELAEQAVAAFREMNQKIVGLWKLFEGGALNAVSEPGRVFDVRGCRFVVRGNYLWLILPSGRPLAYAAPRVRDVLTPWNEMRPSVFASSVNSKTRKWQERQYYGGLWTENVVQAAARDLMAEAMLRQEDAGHRIILTVHDEIVAEDKQEFSSCEEFLKLMAQVPTWAAGCPVAVEGWQGERYHK